LNLTNHGVFCISPIRRADLKGHIRKGEDSDLAYLAPTLIPVPGAFQADGSNPMISHTAENILFKVKKSMILADIGELAFVCRVNWSVAIVKQEKFTRWCDKIRM
jgi:hypothetical protein